MSEDLIVAIGFICSGCNTFWRDNNMCETKREGCPFCKISRIEGGRELKLILYEAKNGAVAKNGKGDL